WVLVRHGALALELLAGGPRLGLLVLFPLAVAASFTAYAWRWKVLLAGLGARPRLAALVGYRAAGQSLSSLIPSGKLGGEPLRTLLLARGGVGGAPAIAAVAVDRTLEMGAAAAFAFAYALVPLLRGVPATERAGRGGGGRVRDRRRALAPRPGRGGRARGRGAVALRDARPSARRRPRRRPRGPTARGGVDRARHPLPDAAWSRAHARRFDN